MPKRKTKTKTKKPRTPRLADLADAPYNPREIDAESFDGLTASLREFGDIAGITWNQRTGHLVSGHQRLRSLREKYGKTLRMARGVILTPDRDRFRVRVVDWPLRKEKAANVAANSPALAGLFTDDVAELLDAVPDGLFDDLRFDQLVAQLDADTLPDPHPPAGTEAASDRIVEIRCTHQQYESIHDQLEAWRADGVAIDVA